MFPEIENVRQVNGVNWSGGVLAQNGKMYGMPWTTSSVCIIKTRISTLPAWMLAPEFNKFYFFFLKTFFNKYYKYEMCFCFSKRDSEHTIINERIEEKRFVDGSTEYYKDSYLHNDNDTPAVVHGKHKEWWFHGMRHRESDKPAITYKDGSKEWWFHGMHHREGDKPAVVLKEESFNYTFFTMEWWFYGKLHRGGGKPAIMRADGTQEYWEYGRRIK